MSPRFQLSTQITCETAPTAIAIGSNERNALAVCDRELVRIDLRDSSQNHVCELSRPALEISVNSSHQLAALTTGTAAIEIYDLKMGSRLRTLGRDGAPGSLRTAPANHVAIASDGKMCVSTTTGSRIFIHNVHADDWEHILFVKYDGCDVAVSPDAKYVALFGAPKASELSGQLSLFRVHRGLQPLWTRSHDSDEPAKHVQFSPDSRTVVSCCERDGVRVWDVSTGSLQFHRKAKANERISAAWSFGDQHHLAILGKTLTVIPLSRDTPIFYQPLQPYSLYAVSPSGHTLLIGGKDAVLSAWKIDHSK